MPIQGVGSLIANDLLTDISYSLFEGVVDATVPAGGIAVGAHTINVWDPSIYLGCQLVVGANTANVEAVTVTAVNPGTSFTATFLNTHAAGDLITGATFPVQNTAGDPLFEQEEMLGYLSNAVNEFLLAVPLAYAVDDTIVVTPTAQFTALPADCMMPVRVAADTTGAGLYPFRETSQANLDGYDYKWQMQKNLQPYTYYRDKIGLQNVGIWPRANNQVNLELVYQQRGAQVMGLADGFLVPDPFLVYIKAHTLGFAYSKDGEARAPGMAAFWEGRYEMGCKISKMFLEAAMATDLQ